MLILFFKFLGIEGIVSDNIKLVEEIVRFYKLVFFEFVKDKKE